MDKNYVRGLVKRNPGLFLAAYQKGFAFGRRVDRALRGRAQRQDVVDVMVELGARQLSTIIDKAQKHRELEAEMAKRTGTTVWKAQPRPAPKPLTERQKFELEIQRRAGIVVG